MTNDNANLPATLPPGATEIPAETVGTALQTEESEANTPPPKMPAASAPRSPGMIMLALFAALLALASAIYFARTRPPAAGAAPVVAGDGAAPLKIELPVDEAPAASGAHDVPPTEEAAPANASPDKIFNDAGSLKETLSGAGPARAAPEGSISELPPAPHALPDGATANDALRNAAKAAARGLAPADDPKADGPPAPDGALLDPEASLQAIELREIASVRNDAKRAIAFAAFAAKARAGEPYAAELSAYLSHDSDAPLSAVIAAQAPAGISTPAMLSARFPGYRDKALAAGRRADAKGPAARLGASLASLVNLRPAGPVPGPSSAAILSRAEAALVAGDVDGALAQLTALNNDAGAALAPWMKEAQARAALEAALAARERALFASLAGGLNGQ